MRSTYLLIGLICAAPLAGQTLVSPEVENIEAPRFGTRTFFRQSFFTPNTRVELLPPTRLDDFVVDGKLELSLRDYLELVLANNTDIQITRLNVQLQKNAIQRAFGIFDPLFFGRFAATRSNSLPNDILAGAETLSTLAQPANFNYTQTLSTGTQYTVGFSASKFATNSAFQTFNPAVNANLNFNFSQPLLRNRGSEITKLPITIARSRLRQSEFGVENQVMAQLVQAENAYWGVIEARESLKVQEEGLALADQALKRTMRELELGAVSPLEVFQPQQTYATAEIAVTQARYRLAQAEDQLRRQMGADLDIRVRTLPIHLTEAVLPPTDDSEIDREQTVQRALELRPDLKAVAQGIDIDDLNIRAATNSLRPDLNLTGGYTSQGRAGVFHQRRNVFTDGLNQTIVTSTPLGGLGSAMDQLFGFGYPVYQMGITLNLPLRNRRANADLADAVVNKRLNTLRVRQTEQNIRLEVLNAINLVENSKASVKLAQIAVDFATKRLEADQKRYDLGTINIFFLLDAQNALVNAQAQLVNQSVQYRRNLLNLLQRTGELFEARGVRLE